ncbi:MAG TPA: helix-turn-helix domain-containing protein [Acidimicrobiales bacterium]|nr:helix-turn-helix domain-containing protein [Acidimicrobiales bacterium]
MSIDMSGGRRTRSDSRQRIVAAAVELFSSQGYAGTSIRDIAAALGMTKASLYYYFESKDQILDAVTEPLRRELEDLVTRASTPPPPAPADLLAEVVDVLSRHALLITTLFDDPSAFRNQQAKQGLRKLAPILASSTEPDALLRARCAMGAVHAGVLGTAAVDARLAARLRGDQAVRLLAGEDHALDEELREAVVRAALRTLG